MDEIVSATSTLSPSTGDLIDLAQRVYADWSTAGALAGAVALINLMVHLTRIRVIAAWLEKKGLKWIRAVLAVLFGALGAVVAAKAMDGGANLFVALIHGAVTGLASVGLHQLTGIFAPKTSVKLPPAPPLPPAR